jgi:hypothetical protein
MGKAGNLKIADYRQLARWASVVIGAQRFCMTAYTGGIFSLLFGFKPKV